MLTADPDIRHLMALRAVESGLMRLKWLAAATRFELAMVRHDRALKANFNPNEPRVPAGNPDGGQWTDGGGSAGGASSRRDRGGGGSSTPRSRTDPTAGSGRNDPRVLSDVTPDNYDKPGMRLAQNDRLRSDPIRLEDEELKGGHTIEYHVNRSEEALKAPALAQFDIDPKSVDVRSGSFPSVAAANKLVNSTLSRNRNIVDKVANGTFARRVVISQFNSVTGIEAVAPNIRSQPYMRNTYGVGVVIAHDSYASRGYRIITAFPTNRQMP
jgi:hypothetical protein